MDVLEKIFGSPQKVKIMRLFLFNQQTAFDGREVAVRTKVPLARAKKETLTLKKIGLVKDKVFIKETVNRKKKTSKKKVKGWILNEKFQYLLPLQNLLVYIDDAQRRSVFNKMKKIGSVKLFIVSGVFIQEWESRVDILLVGDKLKRNAVDKVVSEIESEIGKEINYCVLETKDFLYRLDVYDKLVRDILDHPHKKIINKFDLDIS